MLLSFRSFSDTIFAMVQQIVTEITSCDFTGKNGKFEKILKVMNLENEKFLESDHWVVSDHLLRLLLLKKGESSKRKLVEEGKNIDFEEFLEFTRSLRTCAKISWFLLGFSL